MPSSGLLNPQVNLRLFRLIGSGGFTETDSGTHFFSGRIQSRSLSGRHVFTGFLDPVLGAMMKQVWWHSRRSKAYRGLPEARMAGTRRRPDKVCLKGQLHRMPTPKAAGSMPGSPTGQQEVFSTAQMTQIAQIVSSSLNQAMGDFNMRLNGLQQQVVHQQMTQSCRLLHESSNELVASHSCGCCFFVCLFCLVCFVFCLGCFGLLLFLWSVCCCLCC